MVCLAHALQNGPFWTISYAWKLLFVVAVPSAGAASAFVDTAAAAAAVQVLLVCASMFHGTTGCTTGKFLSLD